MQAGVHQEVHGSQEINFHVINYYSYTTAIDHLLVLKLLL